MRAQASGHILDISSIGGVVGFGGAAAYTSRKFAVEGFSEDMAIGLIPFGIHVTIVEPGFFRTDFLEGTSVKCGEVAVDGYAEADRAQREKYDTHSGKQAGDPAKLGQALLRIVAVDEPPLRYAAGSDAVRMTRDALEKPGRARSPARPVGVDRFRRTRRRVNRRRSMATPAGGLRAIRRCGDREVGESVREAGIRADA